MKNLVLLATLALSTSLMAAPKTKPAEKFSLSVEEIPVQSLSRNKSIIDPTAGNGGGGAANGGAVGGLGGGGGVQGGNYGGGNYGGGGGYYPIGGGTGTINDRIATAGQVIGVARDVVALGEAIYELVRKGKPTNVTEYAPISVVPREPGTKEPVDMFDLEGFSMPEEKAFVAKIKNSFGKEVVQFTYKVMYSYGGSYNGVGKYLTSVIIIPQSVKTTWGWEFNASMKLSGMMNHGTKADPVAGVMLTIKYQMNGYSAAYERNDTIHITGRGEFKNHMAQ